MAIYIDIMNEIAGQIRSGHFKKGTPLPSEERLRKSFSASRTSVRNALDVLQKEGFIEKRRGSGNFVTAPEAIAENSIKTAKILVDLHEEQDDSRFFSVQTNMITLKGINKVFSNGNGRIEMAMYHRNNANLAEEIPRNVSSEGYIDIGHVMNEELEDYLNNTIDAKTISICSALSGKENHPSNPKIINDPIPGIKKAVKHYSAMGKTRFGYAGLAESGMRNLRLFEKALKNCAVEFDYNCVVIHPKDTSHYTLDIDTRAKELYDAENAKAKQFPEVVFHDGTLLLNALMNVYRAEQPELFDNMSWCGIGHPSDDLDPLNTSFVDLIQFQYEQAGEVAAKTLLKWMETDERPPKEKKIPAGFVPAGM